MGPPRDRLGALQAQAYFEDDQDYQVGMDDEQMDGPMAAFFQEMEEMRNNTAAIEVDIQKVKTLQNEILTTPSVDAKTKQELEDAMNNIKKRHSVNFEFGGHFLCVAVTFEPIALQPSSLAITVDFLAHQYCRLFFVSAWVLT